MALQAWEAALVALGISSGVISAIVLICWLLVKTKAARKVNLDKKEVSDSSVRERTDGDMDNIDPQQPPIENDPKSSSAGPAVIRHDSNEITNLGLGFWDTASEDDETSTHERASRQLENGDEEEASAAADIQSDWKQLASKHLEENHRVLNKEPKSNQGGGEAGSRLGIGPLSLFACRW